MILSLGTFIAGAITKSNLAKHYPPPWHLVDVGGYKMHIYCTVQGRPTVILDAGLGDFSVTWGLVQPEIPKTAQVCSFDRAGYGWSAPSPHPRTASWMTEELHTLLINADIQDPYVLVGHTLSRLIVCIYAHSFPDEVVGIILVDSTHEEQDIRQSAAVPNYLEVQKCGSEQIARQYSLFGFLSSTGLMALVQQSIPNPGYSDAAFVQDKAIWATTGYFGTILAEGEALEEILAEARSMDITSFGNLPLIVLTAGPSGSDPNFSDAENQQLGEGRQILQSDLSGLSSDS